MTGIRYFFKITCFDNCVAKVTILFRQRLLTTNKNAAFFIKIQPIMQLGFLADEWHHIQIVWHYAFFATIRDFLCYFFAI
jgi:hypothetical protein